LQSSIRYAEEDYLNARTLIEQCPPADPDVEYNLGCVFFMEGQYEEAFRNFSMSMQKTGYKADMCYNIALCYYKMKQYAGALKYITEIIERGIKDHPELSVGLQTEGLDVRSVGNTQVHNDYTGPQSFIHSIHSILMTVMIQWIYIML
jgi:tetratricopeptide repeat protein 30